MEDHMSRNRQFAGFIAVILLALWLYPVAAEVTVDPFGFAVSIEADDEAELELVLSNSGEEDVAFIIDYNLIENEDQDQVGPLRDDPGDVIDEFDVPQGGRNGYFGGIAWDRINEWMWLTELETVNPARFMAIDPENDYEMVRTFNAPGQMMGAGWYDGIIYAVNWSNNWLFRFDTDGNNVDNLQFQFRPTACTTCPEEGWLLVMNDAGNRDIHIFAIEDNFREIGTIDNYHNFQQNQLSRSILWVDAHPDGQLWMNTGSNNGQGVWEFAIDTEEWEVTDMVQNFFLQGPAGAMGVWGGLGHDGENLWCHQRNADQILIVDDGIREFHMLLIDPENGVIQGEGGESIDIQIITEDLGAGVYDILLGIEFFDPEEGRDDPDLTLTELSVVVTIDDPVFNLSGAVIDAATNEIVEDVRVDMDRYAITRYSNEEGEYSFVDLPLGAYEFTFSATDYLPTIREVNAERAGDINLNVALLHSECNPDPDEIITELAPDTDTQISIEISNDGNGPLTYTVERRLLGDANADPWTLRLSHMFGQDRDDSRIQGAVFAEDRFYVAGAHGNEPAIYIFSREGEYIDLFIQPGEDRYGMKDLAWDGNLIWGAIGQTIYGITLDGDVEVEFEGPFRPTSNLTWDPEHVLLWISATTSNIVGIDRNGNQVAELDRQGLRMYGLAYWVDDPDNSPLYIFHKVRDVSDLVVHKMNLDNGELTEVSILDPEGGGSAAGAFITNEYDIYSWVFIAVANAGADDRVDIWQIDARKEWFLLDPAEGVIEADNTQEFNLTLNATGLPPEVFEGELVFLHDGVGSETHIQVTLRVVEGPVQAERTLQLELGWNMVSVNLQPDPDDIRVLMRELVEADLLLLMKDGQGRFYSPEFDFCNIPGWNVADGYQMKMDDAGELTLEGITVMADDAISLTDGWNLISYYPRTPVDAIVAFSRIVDQLLIAKDGWGHFYNPEWGFSNMGDLQELRGYQVKVTEDLELVYRLQAEEDDFVANACDCQGELPVHPNTGNNMSLLVKSGSVCDGEIGVYANDELVGVCILKDEVCGIAVWGDDPTTPEIDGALEGVSLELKLLDENGLCSVQFETLAGDGLYQTDGFWAIELIDITEIPDEFGIISIYPNPFNCRTRVTYNLLEASQVDLALHDLSGRCIFDLVSSHMNAGQYAIVIDGSSLASGVYVVQLKANEDVSRSKITLLK